AAPAARWRGSGGARGRVQLAAPVRRFVGLLVGRALLTALRRPDPPHQPAAATADDERAHDDARDDERRHRQPRLLLVARLGLLVDCLGFLRLLLVPLFVIAALARLRLATPPVTIIVVGLVVVPAPLLFAASRE